MPSALFGVHMLPGIYSPPGEIIHIEIPLKGNDEADIKEIIESDDDSGQRLWDKFNQMRRDNGGRVVE